MMAERDVREQDYDTDVIVRATPALGRSRGAIVAMVAFLAGVVVTSATAPERQGTETSAGSVGPTADAGTAADEFLADSPGVGGGASPVGGGAIGGVTPAAGRRGTVAAAPGKPTAAPAGGNGGVTFRGVTETAIKIGFINSDSSSLGPVCPRCDNGDAVTEAVPAILDAYRREGLLPIYGRDIEAVSMAHDILSPEQARNACVDMAQRVKPFLVGSGQFIGDVGRCVTQEFKLLGVAALGVSSGSDDQLKAASPYLFQAASTRDRVYRNFVRWADEQGLLKGQVLGLYSPAGSSTDPDIQKILDKNFRAPLRQLGYELKEDMTYEPGNSSQTDALAVQRFQSSGVTVAFVTFGSITEPAGFQHQAQARGYRPKYPIAEASVEMSDSLADVSYNVDAQDGNLGIKSRRWEWAQRRPAVPREDNPEASLCVRAYQQRTGRALDVFDNDSEIASMLSTCTILRVIREALVRAGPNLTHETFVQGLYQLDGLPTAYYPAVSFGPGKHHGNDMFANAQFRKSRWQPSNNYWGTIAAWRPFLVD